MQFGDSVGRHAAVAGAQEATVRESVEARFLLSFVVGLSVPYCELSGERSPSKLGTLSWLSRKTTPKLQGCPGRQKTDPWRTMASANSYPQVSTRAASMTIPEARTSGVPPSSVPWHQTSPSGRRPVLGEDVPGVLAVFSPLAPEPLHLGVDHPGTCRTRACSH